nr:F-box/LRR-repeat protein At5g63520-like isoform X1 [Ipomoea batatas]GME10778.1 F-box/LRR-repeat protein At5g63520-like isoform X1 [Ipomoea batatas]GME10779.1 F-box/LRR-repeat protein At5g63520-like isoform X1 [Ipomoea batatas]
MYFFFSIFYRDISSSMLEDIMPFMHNEENEKRAPKTTFYTSLLAVRVSVTKSNMVSELAGEGAMPLPKPASHAELQMRLRRQIRRGSSLRRGVFPANTVTLFNPSIVFIPLGLDGSSRSRSVEISSRVLVNPLCARVIFITVNSLLDSVCLSEALINALVIVFNCSSRTRSAKGTSTVLVNQPRVCAVEIVCCVSTGFAYRSRMREAPNVTPTRRWPAIPIIVQSSPAKDRSGNSKPSDQQSLDSDFACVNCFSDIDESIAGLMNDEQNFVPGIDHVERFLSQSLEIDDSSSKEIEDEVENLDDGDDERLKAVNKVRRRRRFVFADEDKDDVTESCAAWVSDFKLVLKPYQKKSDIKSDIPDFDKMSPEAQQYIWSSQTRLASIEKELREVKRKSATILDVVNEVIDEVLSQPIRPQFVIASVGPSFSLEDAHAVIPRRLDSRIPVTTCTSQGIIGRDAPTHEFQEVQWEIVVGDDDDNVEDVNMLQDANVGVMDAHSFVWNLATVFGEWKSQYLDDSSQHSGNSQSFLDDSQMKDKTEKEDFNKNKKNKIHEANGWKASLTAVMVKALSDVLFGIGTDLNTSEQKNNDDRFADVSFRSSNGKVHEYDPFSELTFDKPRSAEVRPVPSGSGPKSKQDAEKQSRQIKLCTKVPPSSSKRSCYGGSMLQLGTKNIDKAS